MENKCTHQLNSKYLKHTFRPLVPVSKNRALFSVFYIPLLTRFTQLSSSPSSFSLPVSTTSLRTPTFSWEKSTFLGFRDLMNVHHLYSPLLFSCIQNITNPKSVQFTKQSINLVEIFKLNHSPHVCSFVVVFSEPSQNQFLYAPSPSAIPPKTKLTLSIKKTWNTDN